MDYLEDVVYDFPMKDRSARGERRKTNLRKAERKRNISKHVYGFSWYDNLHQYSKNKVHCSCNLCRFRNAWNPNAKPISDMRKIDSCNEQYREWEIAG